LKQEAPLHLQILEVLPFLKDYMDTVEVIYGQPTFLAARDRIRERAGGVFGRGRSRNIMSNEKGTMNNEK
jgi:hypothetical protein